MKKGGDKDDAKAHTAIQYALWYDLLSFIKRCTDSWRLHFLPDLLLFLFLLLLMITTSLISGILHTTQDDGLAPQVSTDRLSGTIR